MSATIWISWVARREDWEVAGKMSLHLLSSPAWLAAWHATRSTCIFMASHRPGYQKCLQFFSCSVADCCEVRSLFSCWYPFPPFYLESSNIVAVTKSWFLIDSSNSTMIYWKPNMYKESRVSLYEANRMTIKQGIGKHKAPTQESNTEKQTLRVSASGPTTLLVLLPP